MTIASPSQPEAPPLALPELDQADEGAEVDVGVFDLDVGEGLIVDEEDANLDAFQIDIQQQDDPGSSEAASDLDIGMSGLVDALPEPPPASEGDDLLESDGELDRHLEAPLEADDPSTDAELGDDGLEQLPELMADDPDADATGDTERAFLPGAPEGAIPSGPRFEAEWLSLGSPCSALLAHGHELLAAGSQLMRFGAERSSRALPSGTRATSLALLDSGDVILATTRGLLQLTPRGALSQHEAPDGATPHGRARSGGHEVVELCGSPGAPTLWARLADGSLFTQRASVWARHEAGGRVSCLASSGSSVTLLVVGRQPTLQLSADRGSSFRELLLPEPAATVALGAEPVAVCDGPTIAVSDPARGLCVSHDAGASFRMVTGAVNVSASTIGDLGGGPRVFAALYSESRDSTRLIVVDPETGAAASIAELSGTPDDDSEELGRTAALLFHDGALWAAGGYGLAKLRG